MRIIFVGSGQFQHIQKIYQSEGWICDTASVCPWPVLREILNLKKLLMADVIYRVGGGHLNSLGLRLARLLRKKIIVHWIGTDVLEALSRPPQEVYHRYIHLAGSELLREELGTIGISSVVIPIVPTGVDFSPLPMPDQHAVLAYVPEHREEFYGMTLLKEIAEHFPDITFHIVANSGKNDRNPQPNISYEGMLDMTAMREMYARCSILFRYPQHDGMSMMVLEALGTGRTVIYKYKFPYAKTPSDDTFPSILKTFEEVLSTPPYLDQEAVNYVNSSFSMSKQVLKYKKAGIL